MSSKNSKHTHKYYKAYAPNGTYLWTCPDCQHHMPKHYEHTLNNRMTVCWGHSKDCVKEFRLDTRSLALDKPLCVACDPKNAINPMDTPEEIVAKLLAQVGAEHEGTDDE